MKGQAPEAPTLTGTKVRLRPWEAADATSLEAACGDPDICRFTTVPRHYTPDQAESWIRRQHDRIATGSAIVLAIEPTSLRRAVGMIGLFGLDEQPEVGRLGYWVVQSHRRARIATEAVRVLAEWSFEQLGLTALNIDIEPNNEPSRRVAQAVGAIHERQLSRLLDGQSRQLERFTLHRQPLRPACNTRRTG